MRTVLICLALLASTLSLHIDFHVSVTNGMQGEDHRTKEAMEDVKGNPQRNSAKLDDKTEKSIETDDICPAILYSPTTGLSPSFPGVIAHGIHSLSSPDVQRYFPTSAKMPYNFPVVNPDLSSSEPILFSPPNFDHTFKSPTLQSIDAVLTHMDNPNYDMRLYTPLERIIHAAHMQEVWQEAGEYYSRRKETSKMPAEVCECIRKVESNGILKMLRLIALKVREPGLMYGQHVVINNGTMDWSGNLYTYHFVDREADADQVLSDHLTPLPHLNTSADWTVWKTQMASMKKDMAEYSRFLATFMLCVLED